MHAEIKIVGFQLLKHARPTNIGPEKSSITGCLAYNGLIALNRDR